MRGSFKLALGLAGLCAFGAGSADAGTCLEDINACLASTPGHPHICDPLVRNLPVCVANERKGIAQSDVDPRFTKAHIVRVYDLK